MNEATAWYLGHRLKTAIDASGKDYSTPGWMGGLIGGGAGAAIAGGTGLAGWGKNPVHGLIGAGIGGALGAGTGAGYEGIRDATVLDRMKTLVGMSPYDEYGQSADQKITNAMLMGM